MTEQDKQLSLPLAGRDPLGTQSVWQHRARPIVPALTAASRWPEGFQILITALAWWPQFANTYDRRANEQTRFFLLFEQAAGRACRLAGKPWRLPGSRRLTAGGQGVWVGLDPGKHFLLDNPLANGVWGIYRGPMFNAGLLNEHNLLGGALAKEIRTQTRAPERFFKLLHDALSAQRGQETHIARRQDNEIVQYLVNLVEGIPSGEIIRRLFVASTPLSTELARLSMELRETATPEALVTLGQKRLGEDFRQELAQLEVCERYLACIDAGFEALCSQAGNPLPHASDNLSIDIHALRLARDTFSRSGSYGDGVQFRYRELCNASLDSRTAFVEWLLAHHAKISDARHTAPWTTIGEDGRLHCRLPIEAPEAEALAPATSWRNSYYLDALATLARHLPQGRRHG